jgi:hypothetical protein
LILNKLCHFYDNASKKRLIALVISAAFLLLLIISVPMIQEYLKLTKQHSLALSVLSKIEQKKDWINSGKPVNNRLNVEEQLRSTLENSPVETEKLNIAKNNWQIVIRAKEAAFWNWLASLRDLPVKIQAIQIDEYQGGTVRINVELVRLGR